MEDLTIAARETGRNEQEGEANIPEFVPDMRGVRKAAHLEIDRRPSQLRATPRAFAVAAGGRKVDDYYARELVQDAIGDTWSGVLRWDPKRCTLALPSQNRVLRITG